MAKHSTVVRTTLIYFGIVAIVFASCVSFMLWIPVADQNHDALVLALVKTAVPTEQRREIENLEETLRQPRSGKSETAYRAARLKIDGIIRDSAIMQQTREITRQQTIRFTIALGVMVLAILVVMYIILRLILIPLDRLILDAQQVSQGNLRVDFKGIRSSHSEIASLADVLQNLTVNFGEILFVMGNAVEQGRKNLELIRKNSPETENAIQDFEYLLQSMSDLVEHFRSGR
ncbi:MAG: hypothetical protein JNJ69_16740 [Leptospiraceae bacterium]|nr:hypothetical protein [Leptospiraceae bacterium]